MPHLLGSDNRAIDTFTLHCPLFSRAAVSEVLNIVCQPLRVPWMSAIIHMPTMQAEIEHFWNDPSAVDLPWLAAYYALIGIGLQLAAQSYVKVADLPDVDTASRLCMIRCTECLKASGYTKPRRYSVQAMVSEPAHQCIIS